MNVRIQLSDEAYKALMNGNGRLEGSLGLVSPTEGNFNAYRRNASKPGNKYIKLPHGRASVGDSHVRLTLRIALNETLNFLNKQRALNQLSLDDAEAATLNKLESDPYFDGTHTQLLFEQAIQTLPEKQRIVFNLKYFQEMKYEDMSDILGTSIGALKASYHHAVKKIEEFLSQHD